MAKVVDHLRAVEAGQGKNQWINEHFAQLLGGAGQQHHRFHHPPPHNHPPHHYPHLIIIIIITIVFDVIIIIIPIVVTIHMENRMEQPTFCSTLGSLGQ